MLLFLRKFLFYVLAALYLFIVPYTILYALGYMFNPGEAALVKTGLLSIETFPRGATVFVQGKKFSEKTPTAVRDLLPGSYRIRLYRKGLEPWEKEVGIESEKATRLEPVLLLPKRFEDEVISARSYRGMVPAILDAKIYAWESDNVQSLRRIDLFFKKEQAVGRAISRQAALKIFDVHYEPGSPFALLAVREDGEKGLVILEPGREKKIAKGLGTLLTVEKPDFEWDPKNPDSLYFLEKGTLSRADIRRGALYPGIAAEVLGFGARHNRLVFLKKDFSLVETNLKGENAKPLAEDTQLLSGILTPFGKRRYDIEIMEPDLLLFLSEKGALLANQSPYLLADKDVQEVVRAGWPEEDKILFWTRQEISIININREKTLTRNLLYRGGRNIRQVFWAYEDSHVLFLDGDVVYLLEAEGPPPYEAREIGHVAAVSSVIYAEQTHSLYFLDPENRNLVRRKLPD